MILRLSLDLPEDDAYLRMTRQLGRTVLETMETVEANIDDVDTVITELYTNVLRHARSANGRFRIVADYYADRVVLSVKDRGKGFSFRDVAPIGSVRPDFDGTDRIGGFGLELVAMLSNRLDFQRTDQHGTTVRAELRLHYKSLDAATQASRMDNNGTDASLSI